VLEILRELHSLKNLRAFCLYNFNKGQPSYFAIKCLTNLALFAALKKVSTGLDSVIVEDVD